MIRVSKKKKFDLSNLVSSNRLKDGQSLFFVSDPSKSCKIVRHISGEYKVSANGETLTIHGFAQKCLGQEPPDHASKWLRTEDGKTLYELWRADESMDEAA